MKPAIEWINEVGETVANAMFTGKQPPGVEVEELVKRIQADARAQLEADRDAQMTAILAVIGGTVEGNPTSSVNCLQRLRELVAQAKSPEPISKKERCERCGSVLHDLLDCGVGRKATT